MNRTALATVFAAGAILALANSASAATTITLLNTSTQDVGNTADAYAGVYSAVTPAGATWSSDPTVLPPPANQSGVYQSPFNNTPLGNEVLPDNSYFSTGGTNGANGSNSPVTLTLASAVSSFTLLWGSIDTYNTIAFGNGDSFTGTAVMTFINTNQNTSFAADGNGNYERVALLTFSSDTAFTTITFSSEAPNGVTDRAAFEFAFAPVPIPAALPMLMAAVAGLGFAGWRSNRRPA